MIEFVALEAARDRVAERARGALAHDPVLIDREEQPEAGRSGGLRRQASYLLRRLADRLDPAPGARPAAAEW